MTFFWTLNHEMTSIIKIELRNDQTYRVKLPRQYSTGGNAEFHMLILIEVTLIRSLIFVGVFFLIAMGSWHLETMCHLIIRNVSNLCLGVF
jgi:hypothetical protein